MSFELVAHDELVKRLAALPEKERRQIAKKIELIKENPFRFKAIHSKQFSHVFRVRLVVEDHETRLVYVVLKQKIILVCLLQRDKDYRDLEQHLERIAK